jgi:phosphomannomutase
MLFAALAEALTNHGMKVIDIGVCTTPMVYYASGSLRKPSVMITASHNPPQFNGIKLCKRGAFPVSYKTGYNKIEALSKKVRERPSAIKKGAVKPCDILDSYVSYVLRFAQKISSLKVVADAGNGMAGLPVPQVFKKLKAKLVPMYFEPDGTFPNHIPNPAIRETLKTLQRRVVREKADIGVAFDGDADRVGFVDENGSIIGGDIITALLAHEELKSHPKSIVVYDARSSRAVHEVIEESGGKPLMGPIGHALVKELMRRKKAVLGGELVGHYYFRENYYSDDAVIAMLKVMSIMSSTGRKLSELAKPLERYCQSGELSFRVKDKDRKMREIAARFRDGRKVRFAEYFSIYYGNWWFNLRKSTTEPLLRINVEADDEKTLKEKTELLSRLIKKQV